MSQDRPTFKTHQTSFDGVRYFDESCLLEHSDRRPKVCVGRRDDDTDVRIGEGPSEQEIDGLGGVSLALILGGNRIADFDDAVGCGRAGVASDSYERGTVGARYHTTHEVVQRPSGSRRTGDQLTADPIDIVGFEHRRRPGLGNCRAKHPPDGGSPLCLGVAQCNCRRDELESTSHDASPRTPADT